MERYGSNARVGGPFPSPRPAKRVTRTMSERTVLVVWADAHMGEQGWLSLDEYEDGGEELVETVGFLIEKGAPGSKAGHVTVWQTLSKGEGLHPMHIPDGMVRKITNLVPEVDSATFV